MRSFSSPQTDSKILAEELGMGRKSGWTTLTEDLGRFARRLHKLLSDDQKARGMDLSRDVLSRWRAAQNSQTMSSRGETCVLQYDPDQAKEPPMEDDGVSQTRKAHMSRFWIKVMLIIFFDNIGLIHRGVVPLGQIVNRRFHKEVLSRPIARIRGSKRDLCESRCGSCTTAMLPHTTLSASDSFCPKDRSQPRNIRTLVL